MLASTSARRRPHCRTSAAAGFRPRAAVGKDVRIGGGVSTIRQYLEAGLVDEMHQALTTRLLGRGEALLEGIDLTAFGFEGTRRVATELVTRVVLSKRRWAV